VIHCQPFVAFAWFFYGFLGQVIPKGVLFNFIHHKSTPSACKARTLRDVFSHFYWLSM